ncbi:hypothetical protein tb265_14930 [Gemmatimonadetes bacterium T265]|nr:hypothetical protein tb265_14930 [Gemmatimonadetes bacterium T265]
MSNPTDAFQQRADEVVRRRPLALMAWGDLARGEGAGARPEMAGALRIGTLRYEQRATGRPLRLPATVGHTESARHLLLARPPALADRASSLLNALALRFVLARDASQQVLVVDEFEDTRRIPPALRALPERVQTFAPGYIDNWLQDREGASPLVVVHATRFEGAADYDDEAYNAFGPRALAALVDRLRARDPADAQFALAFDPSDPHHPVQRAFEDATVPAVRVRLAADPAGDAYDGAAYANLALRFTADAYPPEDLVTELLATAAP